MNFNCIVIDDENHCIDLLRDYIAHIPTLKIVKTYTEPKVAMEDISNYKDIDIVFIDIEMPLISGLELAKLLRDKVKKIVFTTGHSKYAIDAFETEADAFLLKPYSFVKFSNTVNKLFLSTPAPVLPVYQFFFVKNKEEKNKLTKICYDKIIAVESFGNYVKIYTTEASIVTYLSFDEIKTTLICRPDFIQIHRTFIICTNFIETIDGDLIVLHNKIHINIGGSYKDKFIHFMNKTIIKTKRKSA